MRPNSRKSLNVKLVGLTGGIGSGKTTVAHIFEKLGVPVYSSDDRAKALMHLDIELVQALSAHFGDDIYVDGHLDRARLAALVFQDENQLKKLNSLVHPAVGRDFRAWTESQEKDTPYVIKEAAILIETGGHTEMDTVILVKADEQLRMERVMERDKVSEAAVRARMSHQWSEEDKVMYCDYIIENDGEQSLIEQVMQVHEELVKE
jgi:dephospho-CoA kinase